jgi:Phosphoinositide phospholipase C, Ca2+-dependent
METVSRSTKLVRNRQLSRWFGAERSRLMMEKNPKVYPELEYRYQPLDQQLNAGIRQIELDTFADRQGGRMHRRA